MFDRFIIPMVVIVSVLTSSPAAIAQEACKLTVRNKSGASIGRIDPDGRFRSSSGSSIGSFKAGVIRDSSGASIGKVDSNGDIRSKTGSKIGEVEQDGTLRNSSGAKLGKIEIKGTVRNASGASMGRFDAYVPACRHAAAAYLFFFEPLHIFK